MARTALYRFFDDRDRLLYIGITEDVQARWDTHAIQKRWWPDVVRKDVDWFEDREAAALAERAAIIAEFPLYNVVYAPAATAQRRPKPDTPPALPLYEAVVKALRMQGMTKVDLHARSGVARTTVDAWKNRLGTPAAPSVIAVADVLGLNRAEALRLGGITADSKAVRDVEILDLSTVPTDELLAELRRRIPGD